MRFKSVFLHSYRFRPISLLFLLLLLVAISLAVFIRQKPQEIPRHAAGATAQVTVNTARPGLTIPDDFPGMGLEPFSICALVSLDRQGPTLANLFKNLGPAILRFGGSTVENTYWVPAGTSSCSYDHTVLNKTTIDNVFAFAKKAGVRVIWPVNLEIRDPATYADEAAYAYTVGGPSLYALEIGNEPDLFGWSYDTFRSEWEAYANAIKARVPNAPLSGPATCCTDSWFLNFMNDDSSKIMVATQHIYPLHTGSITDMMRPALMRNTMHRIDTLVQAAKAKNLSLQIDETDPFVEVHIPPAFSFSASLWVADYALSSAGQGVGGINVFGQIPPDPESPINADGGPRATYYGLLFFHHAAPGESKMVPITINTPMNITAYATLGTDGKLRVALINKDQSDSATLQINTGLAYTKASALRMTAPSMSSTSGITFGGAAVAANGTWSPHTVEAVAVNGANSSIHLPPASAVVITYENSTTGM
jgi:hypothetical protein